MDLPVNQIICGHTLDVVDTFPDGFFNCIITSVPYWGLRAYGTPPQIWGGDKDCDHNWGKEQILKYAGGTGKTDVGYYTDNKTHWKSSQGQFCSKCQAWKGELGIQFLMMRG